MSIDNFVKPLYIIQISKNQAPVYFATETKVTNCVLKQLKFEKISSNKIVQSYTYKGFFQNEDALKQWIYSNF